MPDKKKRKKPLKYQGKKNNCLGKPEEEPADQTPPPESPEESDSPELDPAVNAPGADTIFQSIKDKMTPQGESGPDSSSFISDEELISLLTQHEEWVRMGKPQDGSGPVSLKGRDLSGKDFSGRNLEEIILEDVNLQKAILNKTILINANLKNADLKEANLRGAKFWGANLESANLEKIENADLNQFGGTNLHYATNIPPKLIKRINDAFESLKRHIKIVGYLCLVIEPILFIVLLIYLFSMSDFDLHTKRLQLPILLSSTIKLLISNEFILWVIIPIFFIIICIMFNFLLQWIFYNRIIELPAILAMGERLDSYWLLNMFISKNYPHLGREQSGDGKNKYNVFTLLHNFPAILFVWFLAPLQLLLFWLRYLPLHDLKNTFMHLILFSITIIIILYSYFLGRGKLQYGEDNKAIKICIQPGGICFCSGAAVLVIILTILSLAAFLSSYRLPIDFFYAKFQNLAISEADFRSKNLRHLMGKGSTLIKCNFQGADLYGACLQNATLDWTGFFKANLEKANLTESKLRNADIRSAILIGAICSMGDFRESDFRGAKLSGAILEKVNFYQAKLQGADFENANLQEANLRLANLYGAIFKNADMSNADFSNQYLVNVNFVGAQLKKATLVEVKLYDADLQCANLENAILRGAILRRTNMSWASFKDADLSGADLSYLALNGVDFTRANLTGTNFQASDLRYSSGLTRAQLNRANTRGAQLRANLQ